MAVSRLKLATSSKEGEIASQYQSTPPDRGASPAIAGEAAACGMGGAAPAAGGALGPPGAAGAICTVIRFRAPAWGTPTRRNVKSFCKVGASATAVVAAIILTQVADPSMSATQSTIWLLVAIAAALLIGAVAGLANGALVAFFGLPPILATLGSGLVFTGVAIAMTGGSAVMGFPDAVAVIGNAQLFGIPVPLILFAILAVLLHLILTRTAFGLRVTMYGANPLAALYAAIDINRMLLRVYVIAGMFSSVAGLIIMSRANSAKADYGSSYLLLAVLIAVLGGVNPYGGYGRVIGVVLAVLSMQFLSSGLNMLQVSNFARELIWGALLILVMVINTHAVTALRSSLKPSK